MLKFFEVGRVKLQRSSILGNSSDNGIRCSSRHVCLNFKGHGDIKDDDGVRMIRKLLTVFTRSTQIGESVLSLRMGVYASRFVKEFLPLLLENGVLVQIQNRGGGNQRRFRLGRSMGSIAEALAASRGSYELFVKDLNSETVQKDE